MANTKKKRTQPVSLPMLPLRGLMVFPHMVLHFDVGRKKSVAALEQAEQKHGCVFPAEEGGTYYVRANPALHIEKFTVRPLAEKKIPEAKRDCKVIH